MMDFSPTQTSNPPALATPRPDERFVSPGFAARLRDATKAVHREAERTGFLADLIRGRGSRVGYTLFLRNLVPVYSALEAGVAARRDEALLAALAQPGLARLSSLENDVEGLAGADWRDDLEILPEARAYAEAIARAAGEGDGTSLAAHAYARYLGDLSGGQILAPLLARTLGLDAAALRFYAFPDLDDPGEVKRSIRASFDSVPTSGAQADRIITEATSAFRHNIDLSRAVSRTCGAAVA